MTQTPREAAEAKIAALQWASKALRSLGTWDAVKAIDERIAALALPAAPSESAAEGQDADVWYRQTKRLESLCLELNADLARMKAAMEEGKKALSRFSWIYDSVDDRIRGKPDLKLFAKHAGSLTLADFRSADAALATIDAALKGTSL